LFSAGVTLLPLLSVLIVVLVPLVPWGVVGVQRFAGAGAWYPPVSSTCPKSFTAAPEEDEEELGLLVLKSVRLPAGELAATGVHRNA
jgi:hypothetical protein